MTTMFFTLWSLFLTCIYNLPWVLLLLAINNKSSKLNNRLQSCFFPFVLPKQATHHLLGIPSGWKEPTLTRQVIFVLATNHLFKSRNSWYFYAQVGLQTAPHITMDLYCQKLNSRYKSQNVCVIYLKECTRITPCFPEMFQRTCKYRQYWFTSVSRRCK